MLNDEEKHKKYALLIEFEENASKEEIACGGKGPELYG